MTTLYGIDVSKWQGNINWDAVKSSGKVDFAILKIGSGRVATQKDRTFEKNYASAKAAGIPIGGYWYSYAMSPQEAHQEAKACLECMKGKTFEFPIYFDVEEDKQLRLGKQAVSNIIRAFCEELETAGYFVGVYTSKSHFNSYVDEDCKTKYTSWVAHYGVQKTNYSGPYDIWQKSDKGSIPGISGNVDLDECYRNFPHIIKNLGKNGFTKGDTEKLNETTEKSTLVKPAEEQTAPEKPVENLVKPVEEQKAPEKPVKETKKLFDVKIICNSLNIRTGPSLSAKAVGVARNGEVYAIVEEKNGWGKIADKNLWISILTKYVKKL